MDEELKTAPVYRFATPSERARLILQSLVVVDGELDIEASHDALVRMFGGNGGLN